MIMITGKQVISAGDDNRIVRDSVENNQGSWLEVAVFGLSRAQSGLQNKGRLLVRIPEER